MLISITWQFEITFVKQPANCVAEGALSKDRLIVW